MNSEQNKRLREIEDEFQVISRFHFVPYGKELLIEFHRDLEVLEPEERVDALIRKYEAKLQKIYDESHERQGVMV